MANFVFNVALGRVAEKISDGATLRILVLKAAGTDATLKDLDTVSAVLAEASTTEADFTNYPATRKALTTVTATVDDANDKVICDADNVTYTSAGGATNNTTTSVVIFEDVAGSDSNDATAIPLVKLDAVFTTDGNDVTLQFDGTEGFYTAS
jgi:hypothetical protein